jgi:hypothetical protein
MDEISSVLCSRFLLPLHFHVVSEYEDALYDQENADDNEKEVFEYYDQDSEYYANDGKHWFGHGQTYSFQSSLNHVCQKFTLLRYCPHKASVRI